MLVDGRMAMWSLKRRGRQARMVVETFVPLSGDQHAELEAEGGRLLGFLGAGLEQADLRIVPMGGTG